MSAAPRIGRIFAAVFRHAATVVSGLLTIPIIARSLGIEGLAAWALIGTTAFALGLADLGLSVAVQRAAARGDKAGTVEAVGTALCAIALVAPLAAIGSRMWLLDVPVAGALAADFEAATSIALGAGVIGAFAFPFRSFLVVKGNMVGLAYARATAAALQIVTTWTLLVWHASLMAPAIGLFISALVETCALVMLARRAEPTLPLLPRPARSARRLGSLLGEGASAVTINLAAMLALRFDIVILSRVAPLATVAAYSVAFRAVDQSFTLAKQASTALMPRLASRDDRAAAIKVGTALLGGVVASGMAALATRGDGLLIAWAGDAARHPDTQLALMLLAGAAIVASGHEVVASAITLGSTSAWHAAIPLALGYAVNIAITVAGASTYGVAAIAGGTLVGNLVTSVLLWRRGGELLHTDGATIGRMLLPVAVAALASFAVGTMLGALGWHGIVASAVGCGLAMSAGLAAMEATRRRVTFEPARIQQHPPATELA